MKGLDGGDTRFRLWIVKKNKDELSNVNGESKADGTSVLPGDAADGTPALPVRVTTFDDECG